MIRELHAADSSIWILAADGVEVGYRAPIGGFNSARVRGVAFWQPGVDSISIDFIVKSRQVLGREPSAAEALMYDAFLLFHHAVQEVGADRRAVRAFLESLGRTRAPWRGVTGPVSFEAPRLDLLRMDAPGHLGIRR